MRRQECFEVPHHGAQGAILLKKVSQLKGIQLCRSIGCWQLHYVLIEKSEEPLRLLKTRVDEAFVVQRFHFRQF